MAEFSRYREWYWGHGRAVAVLPSDYESEKHIMSKIVSNNLNHPQIEARIKSVDLWLQNGRTAVNSPYAHHRERLWEGGIRGKDILIEAAAIWLLGHTRPNVVLSQKHQSYLIGNRILRIVPYWGRTTGPQHRSVGMFIIKNLKPLLVVLVAAYKDNQTKLAVRNANMSIPLEI